MILGVGVDLVTVSRMERILRSRWAEKFVTRVFSPEEIRACREAATPAQSYAVRFAAKEALAKALGTGFTKGVSPGTVFVRGGERNRPEIVLAAQALAVAENMNVAAIHVSLSHTSEIACAFVVVESR
ncbi:MAG: holo-ACP synthase [Desulfomonile tiedjei]|uniref:Holo-[acyl-carrier-protein] synthase n=1 Tax=Desulfomonile tiedjei TaxID=2358 RepID=A0A9D6Z0M3_9BACT|nr:holo-ACP synthase [Desulfomonile tiedjei]